MGIELSEVAYRRADRRDTLAYHRFLVITMFILTGTPTCLFHRKDEKEISPYSYGVYHPSRRVEWILALFHGGMRVYSLFCTQSLKRG